jgi:hypothetical protein
MSDQTPIEWIKANLNKKFKRPIGNRTYTVYGHRTIGQGKQKVYLIHVKDETGRQGVIGYAEMRRMQPCGTESELTE